MALHDYVIPPARDTKGDPQKEDTLLGYLREVRQDGMTFLKTQRAYPDIDRAFRILQGPRDERMPKTLSRAHCNRLKRQIREVVAMESNLRPMWGYKTDNEKFTQHNEVLNKMMRSWFHGTFADRGIRSGVQWANVAGTGYLSPIWERDYWAPGRGDIRLHDYGPHDVLPFMLPKSHRLQDAYSVTMVVETPIHQAHAMYPVYRDKIVPDKDRIGLMQRGMEKVRKFVSPALSAAGIPGETHVTTFPTVEIYYTYVLDPAVNVTGKPIRMGRQGSNWEYEVPFIGQDIPADVNNAAGQALYRKATFEDAQMYPLRRLIKWTNSCVMEDDSSPWWHGKVPLVKITVDDWPWDYLGYSLTHEGASLQDSHTRLLRLMDDMARAKIRPALQYDSNNGVSKSLMERFDPRLENQRIDVNSTMGEVIKPVLPPQYYDLPAWIPEHLKGLDEAMDYVTASRDMSSFAKARQMPSSDTIEKLMELAGPIVQDISRGVELSIQELGTMWSPLAFQFYSSRRRVQVLGDRGMLPEDYDFDPKNMVPSHMPWEDSNTPSRLSAMQRARKHHENFFFQLDPNSVHQIVQMSKKMLHMQLWRAGFPIDWWTMAETMDIANFGSAPKGTTSVIERWVAQKRMESELASSMQAEAAAATGMPPGGEAPGAGGPPGASGSNGKPNGAAPPGAPHNNPGRPPSGHAPPKIASKDGGARQSVVESR